MNQPLKNMKKIKILTPNYTPKIKKTYNYDEFNIMDQNRMINPAHLAHLKKSFIEYGLLPLPILVYRKQGKFSILEGQHRFELCKQFGVEIYYVEFHFPANIKNKAVYITKLIAALNSLQLKWSITDYLFAYCAIEIEHYTKFREYMVKYKLKNCQIAFHLFGDALAPMQRQKYKSFKRGEYVITKEMETRFKNRHPKLMDILKLQCFKKASHATHLCESIIKVISHPRYIHKVMLKKLDNHAYDVHLLSKASDWVRQFEEIYNVNQRKYKRISFGNSEMTGG